MKHRSILLSSLVAALIAAVGFTAKPAVAGLTADRTVGQLVQVRLLVDNRVAPLYARGWSWTNARRYFEAFPGSHYAVELRNRTDRRVAVLMSVDGLNVVSGTRSNLTPDESMYVLGPFETTVIRGWRSSLDEIRQFVFVDEQRSYAERTNQANGDMGWLRVLAFEERRPMGWGQVKSFYRGGEPSAPAPSTDERADNGSGGRSDQPIAERKSTAAPEAQGLARDESSRESVPGTGWGERRDDHVQRTVFVAERNATDQLVFRYEYASGLRALGIFPRRARVWERENGELGFAKPPQW